VNTEPMTPLNLPIVPPMDRNASMLGIDRISPIPLELRTRQGVGLFGSRRGADSGHIRMHEGIDLLAPIGTPVFTVAGGTIVSGSGGSVLIFHDHGFRYLTFYQHLQNKAVKNGDVVTTGQKIAEVGDFGDSTEDHLHFEIRYPFGSANTTYAESLPIDPTMILFNWEEKSYQNDEEVRRGHIFDNVLITHLEVIRRGRLLRFLLVNVEGNSRDLFIPLHELSPFAQELIDCVKQAFFCKYKVRIVWRDSLFFKGIQATYPLTSIIAEVKVYRP
jgi:hypothetical protein